MDRKIMREIEERRASRLNLVRTADRSEKIRTYNYAQVLKKTRSTRVCYELTTNLFQPFRIASQITELD